MLKILCDRVTSVQTGYELSNGLHIVIFSIFGFDLQRKLEISSQRATATWNKDKSYQPHQEISTVELKRVIAILQRKRNKTSYDERALERLNVMLTNAA